MCEPAHVCFLVFRVPPCVKINQSALLVGQVINQVINLSHPNPYVQYCILVRRSFEYIHIIPAYGMYEQLIFDICFLVYNAPAHICIFPV